MSLENAKSEETPGPICCEAVCSGNFCPSCGRPVEPRPTNFYFVAMTNGLAIRNNRHVCIGRLIWDPKRKPEQMATAWIEHIASESKVAFHDTEFRQKKTAN